MRLIKLLFLMIVILAFIVLGVANMAPVDLYLFPAFLGLSQYKLAGIPLAAVILASFLMGILMGLLIEYIRETKHRAEANRRRREVGKLKREVTTLARETGRDDDDLSVIAR